MLVIGYSGRDVDVLPLIAASFPERLTWVRLPRERLVEPVREALDLLKARGVDIRVVSKWPHQFLAIPATIGAVARLAAAAESPRIRHRLTAAMVNDYSAESSRGGRLLAFARVCWEVGLHSEVVTLLNDVANTDLFDGAEEIARRKLLARAYAKLRRYEEALRELTRRPPLSRKAIKAWFGNVNEYSNTLRSTGRRRMANAIDVGLIYASRLLPMRSLRKAGRHATVRRAQTALLAGRARVADRGFSGLIEGPESEAVDQASLIDAWTWAADSKKLLGDYTSAHRLAERAHSMRFYANYSQRAWAMWKTAEIEMLQGAPQRRVVAALDEAAAIAESSGDQRTAMWIACTRADALVGHPIAARRSLDLAESLASPHRAEDRAFISMVRAECLRRVGDLQGARESLVAARERLKAGPSVGVRLRSVEVALRVIAAGVDVAETDPRLRRRGLRRYRGVSMKCRRLGYRSIEAWCRHRAAVLDGRMLDASLLEDWGSRGMKREIDAALVGFARAAWHVVC